MADPVKRLNAALEGRYRVEREIGEGGMATVYLAHDLRHDRKVALKVLRPELAAVVGADRFLAEIKTTAKLQHPHILPLFDSGEADGLLYYVMPYAEGESLRDRLDRDKQLPVEEAVGIAVATGNALQTAHEVGVVHRDIKPANILLSRGEPLIADFGIALAVGAAGGGRLTETGLSLGTPSYMSPEQASGDTGIGPPADIYALGCVLFEMLAGTPPHVGATTQAVLAKVLSEQPPSVRKERSTVPLHVDAAIRRALEKVPADRFTSCDHFRRALHDEAFRHDSTRERRRPPSAGPWLAGAAGAAVLLAAAFAGGRLWSDATEPVGPDLARSVAVLPFQNRSANPEEYFSDGFADQLINALAKIPGLRVTSRTSSFVFRGDAVDARAVADSLGVAHLVSGSIQQSGERVLVSAQLVEAETGFVIWSASFDHDVVDILDAQEEVAREIARGLNVELSAATVARLASAGLRSGVAHDEYLRGRQFFYQRTPESFVAALAAFHRSIEADPSYAPAYAGAAGAYVVGITYAVFAPDSLYTFAGRALAYASRAVALDSLNAEAYAARGFLRYLTSEYEAGDSDLRRAVELQPSSADALGWRAFSLGATGRDEEALASARAALALDPLSPGRWAGVVLPALVGRRPLDALDAIRRARAIQPELSDVATMFEALSLLLLDRGDDCLALDLSRLVPFEAMCLEAVGRSDVAVARVDSAAGTWTRSSPYLQADGLSLYHAWTGRADEALFWAERASDVSPSSYAVARWPPGIWARLPASDRARVDAVLERLRREARERILEESRRVELR